MGADVIKVEYPPYGDPVRPSPPRRNGRSAYHVQQNRGKRSLSVDLTRPEGISLIEDLIPKVDIVVENYSPGVMERRGLGYSRLRELNPQIIMASISGFGQTGPLSEKTAFDFIAQAYSGLMHMTGEADGPPMLIGAGIADTSTGVYGSGQRFSPVLKVYSYKGFSVDRHANLDGSVAIDPSLSRCHRWTPKSLKCRAERRPLRRENHDSLCGAFALAA